MKCEKCDTINGADAKFCKECGAALDLARHKAAVNSLLESALEAQEKGEYAEAMMAAEAALGLSPENAIAHSIVGVLEERRGNIAAAVAAFERVVELAPESEADREKLEELRLRAAQKDVLDVGKSTRSQRRVEWVPVLLFGAAGALIVAMVVYVGRLSSGPDSVVGKGFRPPIHTSEAPPTPAAAGGPSQNVAQNPATQLPVSPAISPPTVAGGSNSNSWTVEPLKTPMGSSASGGSAGSNAQVPALPENGGSPKSDIKFTIQPTNKAPERSPQMSITIKDGPSEGTRGIDPEAKLREARSEQRAGNYQSASDKYRAALNVLGERASGETWQQLGICLQRLNNTSGAAEAYQKAIRSFERDLAEGRNAESARIGLETAKQALQSLGSG